MVLKGVYLVMFMLSLLSGVLAVTYSCDPFYNLLQERQQTCLGSTIGHNASEGYLTVHSSFSGCENRNESESASTFFSDRFSQWTMQIDAQWEFYFEYTIMWTSPDTNCIVDLTPSGPSTNSSDPIIPWAMVDQNGISNNPLENLTDFALNKPYTRRFIIAPGSPASYRFGFTCARQNGENSTNSEQTAVITHIMYGMTESWANWNTAIFEPGWSEFGCATNTSCTAPPPNEDASCVISKPWGDPVWYYNGSYYASTFSSSPGFDGDFYVDEAQWVDSYILGCVRPYRQSHVTIVMYPEGFMRLRFGQAKHCEMFPYKIVGRPRPNNMPVPPGFGPNCNFTLNPAKVSIGAQGDNYIEFSAPVSAWDTSCAPPKAPTVGNGNSYPSDGALWALVFGIVGGVILIAVILGIIFGVRRHKQRQQKKMLDDKKGAADGPVDTTSERR